jgi:hypothetical protein
VRKNTDDEKLRASIKTKELLALLQRYALGEIDPRTQAPFLLGQNQIRAIDSLLRKSLPDYSSQEITVRHETHIDPAQARAELLELIQGDPAIRLAVSKIIEGDFERVPIANLPKPESIQ